MSDPTGLLQLDTAIKQYPHTEKLISGEITAPGLRLNCLEIEPIHRAFAPMARNQAYDVSELAIATYLQAKAYGKPLIMLPTVLAARLQQGCIVYNKRRRPGMSVQDLTGAKVGVRAYTQTTGMWVRAILDETYGIEPGQIDWITYERGHLEQYEDPAFVTQAPVGKKMLQMLIDGELDAAIFGNDLPQHEDIAPLIPNHTQADQAWHAQHGFVPINHIVVMRRSVAETRPESVREVYRLFKRGKASLDSSAGLVKKLPDGIEALRKPLEMALASCEKQLLMPSRVVVDDIFADCLEFLGDEAR